jgi:hypothetical protein
VTTFYLFYKCNADQQIHTAPSTPKTNNCQLFSNHTPETPATQENQNKCTCVTHQATSPSRHIQQLLDHGHNNNIPNADILPQQLFQTEISENQNSMGDVFDDPVPTPNHADKMDIDTVSEARPECHSPA